MVLLIIILGFHYNGGGSRQTIFEISISFKLIIKYFLNSYFSTRYNNALCSCLHISYAMHAALTGIGLMVKTIEY